MKTDNGQIVGSLHPTKSGAMRFDTQNGQVIVSLVEGRANGYDVTGKTENGQVIISLTDGEAHRSENGATFKTRNYDDRNVKTTLAAMTTNGQIIIS